MNVACTSASLVLALLLSAAGCHAWNSAEDVAEYLADYFSRGKLYYRTLYFDQASEYLFVGAMNNIFRLKGYQVSVSPFSPEAINMEPYISLAEICALKGKSKNYDCNNHIRVILPVPETGELYVCGTSAYSPKEYYFQNYTDLFVELNRKKLGPGIAKCSHDPDDSSTAIMVEGYNHPGNKSTLYTATTKDFIAMNPVIYKKHLLNYRHPFVLNEPHFVGSLETKDHVYFFFREIAVENLNDGSVTYSRIARVCKNDAGGSNRFKYEWTSLFKARLNCSLPGRFPFYFNEIQSVYQLPDQFEDQKFYAVFTTSPSGPVSSAICAFDIADVEAAFSGEFKEQKTLNSAWQPVPSSKVPTPHPGSTCANDSKTLSKEQLSFIRSHPLMHQEVLQSGGSPVFYAGNVEFTHIIVDVVERDNIGGAKGKITIIYAGTSDGKIYKVSHWMENNKVQSKLLDIFQATTSKEKIQAMEISRSLGQLYVSSDLGVRGIRLEMCYERYTTCYQCAADPICSWNSEENTCEKYDPDLLSDPRQKKSDLCTSSVRNEDLNANIGRSIHLDCDIKLSTLIDTTDIEWTHHSKTEGVRSIRHEICKYLMTTHSGLIIENIEDGDAGLYECKLDGKLVATFNVAVGEEELTSSN